MNNKKALLIIQGINKNPKYIQLTGPLKSYIDEKYDTVEYSDTEKIFDKGWFSKISDKLDFIPYFLSKKRRLAICRHVNEKINTLNLLGYDVDVLAHSLGCVIGLQSGREYFPVKVNKFIALCSPTHSFFYGGFVRSRVNKYSSNITIENIIFTYNKKDFSVANTKINLDNFFKNFKGLVKNYNQYRLGSGHGWELPLKLLRAMSVF